MKTLLLVATLTLAVPVASCAQTPAGTEPVDAPALSGMRAHLFENKTSKLSDDVLDAKDPGLWNIVAGARSANAALVVVEVSGPSGGTYTGHFGARTKYQVRLVATEKGRARRLLDQSQVIPVLSAEGKVYLGFLIHPGGCAPVRLSASIVGPRASPRIEKSLNFACGE